MLAAAGLLLGSAEVIFSNAAQSVLPALVPPELLPKANGSQQVSLTVGESFLGPPAGSLLFAAAAALPFGLDAVSFAGSAALLARLPRTAPRHQPERQQTARQIRTQIAEGLRWLARHRLLRVVAVLLGVYNFANQMGQAVLVLLATQTLHVSTRGYGLLLAASAVGSVVGGLVNPVLTRRLGMLPSLVLPAVIDAAAFVGIGLAPGPAVAAALLAVQGFSVTMWNVVTVSLRQRIVPGHLLGRVNSVYRMLGWGLMPARRAGRRLRGARGRPARPLHRGRPACAACPPASPSRSCWPPAANAGPSTRCHTGARFFRTDRGAPASLPSAGWMAPAMGSGSREDNIRLF